MCPTATNVRSCITLFCKLLQLSGFSTYSAEDFRLAKFNDSRSLESMMRLVYEMLYFTHYNCIDDTAHEGFRRFSSSEVGIYIYNQLLALGYSCLPPRSDFPFSSRGLLLAAAWLFDICGIERKILALAMGNAFQPKVLEILPACGASISSTTIQQLTWLIGRLRIQLKEFWQQRRGVLNEYIKFIQESPSSTVSPLEFLSLSDENAVQDRTKCLDTCVEHVSILKSWKDECHIFWRWMQSVFVLHASENGDFTSDRGQTDLSELSKVNEQFNSFLDKYTDFAKQVGCTTKSSAMNPPLQLEAILYEVDRELEALSVQLEPSQRQHAHFLDPLCLTYTLTDCPNPETKDFCVTLADECSTLDALIRHARNLNQMSKKRLSETLQDFASRKFPDILPLYDPATSCNQP
ncbi:uncharacterized protein DEA37_0001975 [Paragonimus westermani]|uniref:Tubulin epsilon and delta complex protein 1 domain-containing protein n=1 Tax=Paragonimus westermani TaxID=34504 RepID=A0A5J4P330_9TREM|nr:uncharacterized protein DEA37_0001975 [Paragonimus westermani]